MLDRIAHRGPDDHDRYIHGPLAFGMLQQNIIDRMACGQPVHYEDAAVRAVFNSFFEGLPDHDAIEYPAWPRQCETALTTE